MSRDSLARLIVDRPDHATLRQRAAALRLTAARLTSPKKVAAGPYLVADNGKKPIDWTNPPAGFIAYPSASPKAFLAIELAIPAEARRLYDVAKAEFDRVAASLAGDPMTILNARRELHLDALHGIVHGDPLSLAAAPAWTGAEGFDPAFAAIACHRQTWAALGESSAENDHIARTQLGLDTSPEKMAEAGRRHDAANRADFEAWAVLVSARPSTPAGLRAWLGHLDQHRDNYEAVSEHHDYFAALCDVVGSLIPSDAQPAPPVAYEPGGEAPDDLAQACDWAIRHGVWINDVTNTAATVWDDAQLNDECDKASEVVDRAIAEPSRTVADMTAKTRLALDEFKRHEIEGEGPGQHLAAVVLREFLALAARSAPPPSLPTDQAYPRDPFYLSDRTDPVFAAYDAHQRAYAEYIGHPESGNPETNDLMRAEEAAYRALLHTPLTTDAGRLCYALAVIEHEGGALGSMMGDLDRDDPLAVAYRNLRHGQHEREEGSERGRCVAEPNSLDCTALSITDLRSGHDIAGLLSEVATAMLAQPRCWEGKNHNALGRFMSGEADRMQVVRRACREEMRQRGRLTGADIDCRFEVLSVYAIENDEPDDLAEAYRLRDADRAAEA